MIPWLQRHKALLLACASLALLGVMAEAEARVGGGQSYRGGSRGGGGFSGGGGDGGGELIMLLIRLVIYYPKIGIPLVIVVGIYFYMQNRPVKGGDVDTYERDNHVVVQHHTRSRAQRSADLKALASNDPAFSSTVFQDQVEVVHRRAWQATNTGGWDALTPYISPNARQQLESSKSSPEVKVSEVVLAGMTPVSIQQGGKNTRVVLDFKGSRLEEEGGRKTRVYLEERWVFLRRSDALTKSPEETRRMGCPSCGVAVETTLQGLCTHCGAPVTEGQLTWIAESATVKVRRALTREITNALNDGGVEPGFTMPSVVRPALGAELRAFSARHPDFDSAAWEKRVRHIFLTLQQKWSEGRWSEARPYVTDATFNSYRFWTDAYKERGERNRVEEVTLEKMQVVAVDIDAWFDSITVRLWASCLDWTEDAQGKVIGGNRRKRRSFSEYWTLIRAVGSGDKVHEADRCPSCGAPLDNVNAAGICGYCDSLITTGKFDWVLARIDQPDAYHG